MNTINYHIRIRKELLEELKKYADKEGRYASEIIREQIVKYIKNARLDQSLKESINEKEDL